METDISTSLGSTTLKNPTLTCCFQLIPPLAMKTPKGLILAFTIFVVWLMAIPWILGGNLPPVRTVCMAMVCLFSVYGLLFVGRLGTPTTIGLLMKLILVSGIAYAGFQLWPILDGHHHSTFPAETRSRICELVLGIGMFFVASFLFSNKRLCLGCLA